MAIRQKAIATLSASSAFLTRSWSPTEAPPVVIRMSAPISRARRIPLVVACKRIRRNAEVDHFRALGAGQRPQRVAIGIDDLAESRRFAGHHQFIAGGEQSDLWPPADGQERVVHGGGEREIAVGKLLAGRQQHVAFTKIDAGAADMAARDRGFSDGNTVALDDRVFLNDDGIGTLGNDAAGKNAHGLAGAHELDRKAAPRRSRP